MKIPARRFGHLDIWTLDVKGIFYGSIDDDGGILEMDDEPPRSISDAGIKNSLGLQYGIVNAMDVQNLEKNQRNKIIKELCDQGAGFRQLARITGISYGIIQYRSGDSVICSN